MRYWFLIVLFLPFLAQAKVLCPAGYTLNTMGLCSQKWRLEQRSCNEGYYFDTRANECRARCPFRSIAELSMQGDMVCQVEGKREWLTFFRKRCAEYNMRYQPQIHMCEAGSSTTVEENEEAGADCGEGTVAKVVSEEKVVCVPGNPEQKLQQMEEKLQREGLDYLEYLEALKDIQTNKFAAQVLHYQWQVATGKRQAPTPARSAAPAAVAHCPESYKPNEMGGCRPTKSCSSYGCPNGKPANLITDGRNQYCGC